MAYYYLRVKGKDLLRGAAGVAEGRSPEGRAGVLDENDSHLH